MFVKTSTFVVGVVAAVIVGAPAQAEVFKDKKGEHGCVLTAPPNDLKRSDGTTVRRTVFSCVSTSDTAAPFNYMTRTCVGSSEIAADGKADKFHGFCEVLSTKGDRASYSYVGDASSGTAAGNWMWVNGTGAFAGLKGGGTFKVVAGFPNGSWYTTWTGSWETSAGTASK